MTQEPFFSDSEIKEKLNPQSPIVLKDGKIVGINLIKDLSDTVTYIWDLAVLPEHRGKGLGKYLMLRSHEIGHQQGFVKVLFVIEELIERSDSKLGFFGNLVHGDIVVSLPREELKGSVKYLTPMPEFFSFPARKFFFLHFLFSQCFVSIIIRELDAIFYYMISYSNYRIRRSRCQTKKNTNIFPG